MAKAAVKSAKRDFVDSVHIACLKTLSDVDKLFLEAMSKDKGSSRMADIQERLKVSPAYAQQYRSRLLAAGVILSEQRGRVEFAVPYLGKYLRGEIGDEI